MKNSIFIKDKLYDISSVIVLCALVAAVLYCFDVDIHAVIITNAMIILSSGANILADMKRRKKFLDALYQNSHNLDKAYLVLETLNEPEYSEGKFIYELLLHINTSMAEEVKMIRNESSEFRDYIELWVHEVKLPISAMNLKLTNLIQKELASEDQDAASRIADYRKLLSVLNTTQGYLEQIMYYSRLEVSSKDYHLTNVAVNDLIKEVAVKNREMVSDKGVTLEVVPLSPDRKVVTDDKWMVFILGQLISNSLKYTSDKDPVITLSASMPSEKEVLIKLRDNGIGIPSSDIDMVFEKSFTGENGRLYSESTGMGLYIVKTLCDRLGHKVLVESVQSEWTEVTISIGINDYLDTSSHVT